MNTSFIKRFLAYFIDIIVLGIIILLIYNLIPQTKTVTNLQVDIALLNESYLNKQIKLIEYLNNYSNFMYQIDKSRLIYIFINFIAIFIYFIIIPFITKGRTLGKFIMGIKIESSKEKLSLISLFTRNLIINGLGYLILSLCALLFFSKEIYIYVLGILGIVQITLVIISAFMIIYRKDKRAIEDIVSKTNVVNTR